MTLYLRFVLSCIIALTAVSIGFAQVDVLHKNVCFAAFGAVKG